MIAKWVVGAVVAAVVVLTGSGAATASEPAHDTDPRIVYALEAEPGGIVLDERTVFWPQHLMWLTLSDDDEAARAIGSCPSGLYCAYSSTGLSGSRLSWTACGTQSTAALATVGSIANARLVGRIEARNGATVLATAYANSWTNTSGSVSSVACFN